MSLPVINFGRPYLLILSIIIIWIIYYWNKYRSPKKRIREYLVLLSRIIIVILLLMVLADFRFGKNIMRQAVVFIIDVSDSINRNALQNTADYINNIKSRIDNEHRAGIIVFGKNAMIETPVNPELHNITTRFSARPLTDATNIADALTLAESMFPEYSYKKIVLFSDGNQNFNDADYQLMRLKSKNIPVHVIPSGTVETNDIILDKLSAVSRVKENEKFVLKVNILNPGESNKLAKLNIFSNDKYLGSNDILLAPGRNIFNIPQKINEPGAYLYTVNIDVPDDSIVDNNTGQAIVVVIGKPSILFVYEGKQRYTVFTDILKSISGNRVDIIESYRFPSQIHLLYKYDAIIFSNVSAVSLSPGKMNLIKQYVQHLGGGLLVCGGENSFGMGGYYQTQLEEILPVRMDVKKADFIPGSFLSLIIDKSGSMGGFDNNTSKIELAKTSAVMTTEVMAPQDEICVIAFDGAAKWIVDPIQIRGNKGMIIDQIGTLRAGGGTNMYPALELAYNAARNRKMVTKHFIVLSDGQTSAADFPGLIDNIRNEKITVTTVGVGSDADKNFLENLALGTNGRFYWTDEAARIPQIFMQETFQITKNMIVEEKFKAAPFQDNEILKGIDFSSAPNLLGYVRTEIKKNILTHQLLRTPKKDPLMAYWNYGLGKSAVFTSDIFNRWGINWLNWQGFKPLFHQFIKKILRQKNNSSITLQIENQETDLFKLKAVVRNNNGQLTDNIKLKADIIYPDGESQIKKLTQTAPGEYTAEIDYQKPGGYFITVTGNLSGNNRIMENITTLKSSNIELTKFDINKKLLHEITGLTGGMENVTSDILFAKPDKPIKYFTSYWKPLLITAMILMLLEICCRRVYISYNRIKKYLTAALKKITASSETKETDDKSAEVSSSLRERIHKIKHKPEKIKKGNFFKNLSDVEIKQKTGSVDKIPEKIKKDEEKKAEDTTYLTELLKIKKRKK